MLPALASIRVVRQYQRGVHFRLARVIGELTASLARETEASEATGHPGETLVRAAALR